MSCRARRGPGRGRGAAALGGLRVRELREAQQEDFARSGRRCEPDRGLLEAGRHGRLAPRRQDRREAGDAGDDERQGAPRKGARLHGERDLGPAGGKAHPLARQAPDGEDAARVLPQRADEGDPEGARRRRGRPRRGWPSWKSASSQDEALEGSPRKGGCRAEEAAPDVADVGGSDRRAQLSRLAARHSVGQEVEDQEGPRCFAQNVLDTDHFGLDKVKERIVEYLAVQSRRTS
jgi:hypothetical protein